MGFFTPRSHEVGASDPVLTRMAAEDKIHWWSKPNLRYLYFMLFWSCMGIEMTSGFDSQMINALQIVPSWVEFFDDPQGSRKGIISAAYALGAIISLPFIPVILERYGRRWGIFGGSWVMVVGAIIQCFSQNTGMYVFARMVLGFGIPICIVAGSSLIGELSFPKERPVMTSLFNVAFFPGSIIAAGICFATNNITSNWGWRLPSLLQLVPSVIQIITIFFVPESPRWLIAHDRHEEAHDILIKYHAEGDRDSAFVAAEMAQIRSTIALELEANKQSWWTMAKAPGMQRRMVITAFLGLFTQWSGNTLISYYLGDLLEMTGNTSSVFKQKINLSNSCWQLVTGIVFSLAVLKFRRRVMYMVCVCCLLVVYICWTVTMQQSMEAIANDTQNRAAASATIFFIFLYSPCYNIGYNALTYTYLVELWPYALRSRGIAFFQFFGRSANFFTTFVNPIGLENIEWRWLILYCCWLAFEIVFVWFMFPETFGRTLEELAFLFEDKDLADKAVIAVEKVIHTEDMSITSPDDKRASQTQVEQIGASSKV